MNLRVIEFREEFADGVAELYEHLGWKFSPRLVGIWGSMKNYSRVLVALLDGRVVGKVTLDTVFPPYAEIVNLVVHPRYQGRGIGRALVEECIRISESIGHNVQFLMTEHDNLPALNLYRKLGFYPVIPSKRKQLWLFRFGKGTFVEEFLSEHSLSEFRVFRRRVDFHGERLYGVAFTDIQGDGYLRVYFRGQPGQGATMPRIAGISFESGEDAFDAVAYEGSSEIGILNRGKDSTFRITPIAQKGLEASVESQVLRVPRGQERRVRVGFQPTESFDAPLDYLSFRTIVASFRINGNFVISLGRENR
ncbi:GNAT family N-acetyltransferase [Thermococcus radiotolerans]|uniref:N-acetyltransferase domain-containing protein n=1 Tax=Thermococcus radiotolerans TaxID=187880 RepID=A0A2Z2MZL9_9EURY|nr:GNAT family N-acetyltransferase [Thermococcus radiotolerans]ASJ13610.1 hypothetical protein A3L10_00130 [Thermococcus radiotolerans]